MTINRFSRANCRRPLWSTLYLRFPRGKPLYLPWISLLSPSRAAHFCHLPSPVFPSCHRRRVTGKARCFFFSFFFLFFPSAAGVLQPRRNAVCWWLVCSLRPTLMMLASPDKSCDNRAYELRAAATSLSFFLSFPHLFSVSRVPEALFVQETRDLNARIEPFDVKAWNTWFYDANATSLLFSRF